MVRKALGSGVDQANVLKKSMLAKAQAGSEEDIKNVHGIFLQLYAKLKDLLDAHFPLKGDLSELGAHEIQKKLYDRHVAFVQMSGMEGLSSDPLNN